VEEEKLEEAERVRQLNELLERYVEEIHGVAREVYSIEYMDLQLEGCPFVTNQAEGGDYFFVPYGRVRLRDLEDPLDDEFDHFCPDLSLGPSDHLLYARRLGPDVMGFLFEIRKIYGIKNYTEEKIEEVEKEWTGKLYEAVSHKMENEFSEVPMAEDYL
jgi:predicted hydrocarbon binding protein